MSFTPKGFAKSPQRSLSLAIVNTHYKNVSIPKIRLAARALYPHA